MKLLVVILFVVGVGVSVLPYKDLLIALLIGIIVQMAADSKKRGRKKCRY